MFMKKQDKSLVFDDDLMIGMRQCMLCRRILLEAYFEGDAHICSMCQGGGD